jgi:hypothetical protein
MEHQPETFSAVTTPVKMDRLRKSAIRSQNKRAIYNVYKFYKDISGQPENFNNINVRIRQTSYLDVSCDVVPVAAENYHAYTTYKHTLCFLLN